MKGLLFIFSTSLLCLQGFSQFPLHTVLPMGVGNVVFGDTLLNTRAILQREGIQKITAVQTSSGNRSSFTTTYAVTDGRIESRTWCYRRSPDTAFRFCHHDTLLYNGRGLREYRAGNSEEPYMRILREYKTDRDIRVTWIVKDPQKALPDTTTTRYVYNEGGQLISQRDEPGGKSSINAWLYYNPDGLLDSIRHENPASGTFVFKRKKKGSNKELTLETDRSIFHWMYNAQGQCLSSDWSFKKSPDSNSRPLSSEVIYAYNDDGTLAKVVEKRANEKLTTVYTYAR